MAQQAVAHARQRSFRDLDRESRIGEQIIRVFREPQPTGDEAPPEITEALRQFTSKGKERQEWTTESTPGRVLSIGRAFGEEAVTSLHFPYFALYGDSSQIVHGSFYGAILPMGMTDGNPAGDTPDELREHSASHLMIVTLMVSAAASALIKCIDGWRRPDSRYPSRHTSCPSRSGSRSTRSTSRRHDANPPKSTIRSHTASRGCAITTARETLCSRGWEDPRHLHHCPTRALDVAVAREA